MKIQTFSVVVGGNKCNACCPYCVSKMTGKLEYRDDLQDVNIRNFHKACRFAEMSGVTTVLLTGKGEPLLYKSHIDQYLRILRYYNFPFVELQTNGIELHKSISELKEWYNLGLTTVSLSCAHWQDDKNRIIFGSKYDSLEKYVNLLHENKFSVRVSCVMLNDMIRDLTNVLAFTEKCKEWKVEQFTVRPVNYADFGNKEVIKWGKEHRIDELYQYRIEEFLRKEATLLLQLVHEALVFDYKGQNISINNCLTESPDPEKIRQLIFFPDGHLRFSWVHDGAIII